MSVGLTAVLCVLYVVAIVPCCCIYPRETLARRKYDVRPSLSQIKAWFGSTQEIRICASQVHVSAVCGLVPFGVIAVRCGSVVVGWLTLTMCVVEALAIIALAAGGAAPCMHVWPCTLAGIYLS